MLRGCSAQQHGVACQDSWIKESLTTRAKLELCLGCSFGSLCARLLPFALINGSYGFVILPVQIRWLLG
jgi:hypothetical protein